MGYKGSANRAKNQIYLSFSEREYLRRQSKVVHKKRYLRLINILYRFFFDSQSSLYLCGQLLIKNLI